MEFVIIVTMSSKQWLVISTTVHVKKLARHWLTTKLCEGWKKREQDQMRKEYIQQKGYKIIEMWECNWWELYRTDAPVKSYLRANFPYKRLLSEEQLLQGIIDGRLFGYVQCDIEVPEHLRDYLSKFPPIFKNTVVSTKDIEDLMKEYAEKEGIMSQPRRMLISSFILTNGTIITPLLLFYLKLGLVCKKIHQFVFKTLPINVLTIWYSLPWMHDDKEMKIQIPVLLPRLWNY